MEFRSGEGGPPAGGGDAGTGQSCILASRDLLVGNRRDAAHFLRMDWTDSDVVPGSGNPESRGEAVGEWRCESAELRTEAAIL